MFVEATEEFASSAIFYSSCSCLSFRIIFNIHKFPPPLKIGCIFTSFHFNPFRHIVPSLESAEKYRLVSFFFIDFFMYRVEMIIIDDLCSRIYSSVGSLKEMGKCIILNGLLLLERLNCSAQKRENENFCLNIFILVVLVLEL